MEHKPMSDFLAECIEASAPPRAVRKRRIDLIPSAAIKATGDAFAFGHEKYAGRAPSSAGTQEDHFAAIQRHLWDWQDGEKADPESGLSHLAHAMARIAMMIQAETGNGR